MKIPARPLSRLLEEDLAHMHRALRLARRGLGWTSPNPCVGAVLVRKGLVVGEGYHQRCGEPHAERVALDMARSRARGATLYVNLEPCCHQGRTPPCTGGVIDAGIKRVVAAISDPDPRVSGAGFALLRKAGIECFVGVLEAEARCLNEFYLKHRSTRRPFVTLKIGMSLDGKIATRGGESKWITSDQSRALVQRLRHEHDAVMVGINTVLIDDPQLNCRLKSRHRDPLRIVADSRARLPVKSRCLSDPGGPLLLATTKHAPARRVETLRKRGAEVLNLPSADGGVDLARLMTELGQRDILSVLLEGGGTLAASALAAGIVDKVTLFLAPILIGGQKSIPAISGAGVERLADVWRLRDLRVRRSGPDLVVEGYVATSQ